MARILIVGGGCRGLKLARELVAAGDAVRITTRTDAGRTAIEQAGAQCWVGDPGRLATLRGVLDGVAVAIWALGTASGDRDALRELHDERVGFFSTQAIDSTVRGLIYESGGAELEMLARGEQVARTVAQRNAIPFEVIHSDPREVESWCEEALGIVRALL